MERKTLKELWNDHSDLPTEPGIYRILIPDGMEITFKERIENHPNDAYLIPKLQEKYDKSRASGILYIGKAGGRRGLRQRLGQYLRYGFSSGKNHRGGRAIFQIEGFENLICAYEVCPNCEEVEHQQLHEFRETYKTFPVANWRE